MLDPATPRLGITGLGSVGLRLAVEFGKQFPTVGFDSHETRIQQLKAGIDHTLEVTYLLPAAAVDGRL